MDEKKDGGRDEWMHGCMDVWVDRYRGGYMGEIDG